MSKKQVLLHAEVVAEYCRQRVLDFHQFSPYHMRIDNGGYVIVDLWTTGRYWVSLCDYSFLEDAVPERGGEKGLADDGSVETVLDELFFGADMSDVLQA